MLANQPQGGIVFDSDPYDEWMETINKLGMSLFFIVTRKVCTRTAHEMLTQARRKHAVHRVGRAEASR
jgi:isochorismate synthase EntC